MTINELTKEDKIIAKKIIEFGMRRNINRDKLLWDGVVSPEKYLDRNNKYKIMWMLKEPYDDNDCGGYKLGTDLLDPKRRRSIIKSRKCPQAMFGMTYVTFGLLNNKYLEEMNDLENDTEMLEVLTRIAWVNISKALAKHTSPDEHIVGEYNYWKEILFKQIKTYSPDILIFGGTYKKIFEEKCWEKDWKEYFGISPQVVPKETRRIGYFFQNDTLVIRVDHPTYPYMKDANISEKNYVNNIIETVHTARGK
jgi:hypothetical protein